jgi:hypothetical protein
MGWRFRKIRAGGSIPKKRLPSNFNVIVEVGDLYKFKKYSNLIVAHVDGFPTHVI